MAISLTRFERKGVAPLSELLRPRSIAVVGASQDEESQGYRYLSHLRNFGFRGPIYPVNPRYGDILDLPCYPDVASLPADVDYVISCIPAASTPLLIEQCAQKGVKLIHFYTGRFSETGRQPAALLEREVLKKTRQHQIRILGPNCVGLYDPSVGISFKYNVPKQPGPVGFLSQSGGLATRIAMRGGTRGLRFTQVVSYGNGLDINESELLEHFAGDPQTKVIGAYIEGVRDGQRFVRTLKDVASRKPVVLLKGGHTASGARATLSHTASLAGASQVWSAAVKQAGAIEVRDVEEMVDLLLAFALLPPARGLRVGVAGGGGGPMVLSADSCEEAGLIVEPLPTEMRAWLKERAPQVWDWLSNPVDGSIVFGAGILAEDVLKEMAASPHFDLLIGVFDDDGPWGPGLEQQRLRAALEAWTAVGKSAQKPLVVVLGTTESPEQWRWRVTTDARERLAEAGIPTYPSVQRAARAFSRFARYWLAREGASAS